MYESILQQKQDIKREERLVQQKLQEYNDQKQSEQIDAKKAMLDDFDKTQNSMLGNRAAQSSRTESKEASQDDQRGTKRKFELSKEEIRIIAEKDLEKATTKLQDERSEAAKPKMASFWVVSLIE
jgi:nitric oxide synthase-interacting protein